MEDIYYYTKVDTMRYILQGNNIYATNIVYMNDSEEYINGLNEMKNLLLESTDILLKDKEPIVKDIFTKLFLNENWNGFKESASDIYSISFSTKRDLLSQWSMYAGESGVNLKMDFSENEERGFIANIQDGSKDENKEILWKTKPQSVYYLTKSEMNLKEYNNVKNKISEEFIFPLMQNNKCTYDDLSNELMRTFPYIKRYEFNAEGEYRLVFNAQTIKKSPRIDYRIDKNVLKPYIDIECEDGWPITEITIGPGFNQDVVFKSICHFLYNKELKLKIPNDNKFYGLLAEYLNAGLFESDTETNETVTQYIDSCKRKVNLYNSSDTLNIDNGQRRYSNFKEIRKNLLENEAVSDIYKGYLHNNYFSMYGIILKKSKIPYIF